MRGVIMKHEEIGEILKEMCEKMIALLEEQKRLGKITEEEYIKQTNIKKQFLRDFEMTRKAENQIMVTNLLIEGN